MKAALHIEDSDDLAALVEAVLGEEGFQVDRARTLEEGATAAAAGSYVCAFVDLDLPDAQGLEAVVALRRASPGLPLIVLSGQPHSPDIVRAMLLGAQDWVGKHEISGERLAHAAVLAVARHDAQALQVWRASHDALTGLPNRALALDHLTRALARSGRRASSVAVLFCDLDEFKAINDRHGHAAGDAVLKVVAHRLTVAVRPGDLVARWGGDEFVVAAEDVESADHAVCVADRVATALEAPIRFNGLEAVMSITLGVALSAGATDGHALIAAADAAMYRAKRSDGRLDVAVAPTG